MTSVPTIPALRLEQRIRRLPADLETPVSLFMGMNRKGGGILFESAEVDGRWGRYSIIAADPLLTVRCGGGLLKLDVRDQDLAALSVFDGQPFVNGLRALMRAVTVIRDKNTDLPPITRALYGYFGYGMAGLFSPHLAKVLPPESADCTLILPRTTYVADHLYNRLFRVSLGIEGKISGENEAGRQQRNGIQEHIPGRQYAGQAPEPGVCESGTRPSDAAIVMSGRPKTSTDTLKTVSGFEEAAAGVEAGAANAARRTGTAPDRLEMIPCAAASAPVLLKTSSETVATTSGATTITPDAVTATPDAAGFKSMVERIKGLLGQGEAIQVVPSARFSAPYRGDMFTLYRRIRDRNPSPYMFYMELPGICLLGASPEVMVRCTEDRLQLSPIAGTRRRGGTSAEDARLAEELRSDPKECAEHTMLVDLGRNDLGRIAQAGSVKVERLMDVEKFSHVMHMTSRVTAQLREGLDALDVLAATFPAGTVSGAPKTRAMEILAGLEPQDRGPYAGCIGWLGLDRDSVNMDTGITIRSMWRRDGVLHWQAGAGIVHDSDPEAEWKEVCAKAAILRSVLCSEAC